MFRDTNREASTLFTMASRRPSGISIAENQGVAVPPAAAGPWASGDRPSLLWCSSPRRQWSAILPRLRLLESPLSSRALCRSLLLEAKQRKRWRSDLRSPPTGKYCGLNQLAVICFRRRMRNGNANRANPCWSIVLILPGLRPICLSAKRFRSAKLRWWNWSLWLGDRRRRRSYNCRGKLSLSLPRTRSWLGTIEVAPSYHSRTGT